VSDRRGRSYRIERSGSKVRREIAFGGDVGVIGETST
jgi:hypothetical protein